MALQKKIQLAIEHELPGALVKIENPQGDGLHFHAFIVSDLFEGLTKLAQHKRVNKALKPFFDSFELHAMSFDTLTPAAFNQLQQEAPIHE